MSRAIYENTTYVFENNGNIFTSNHRVEKFEGYKGLFRKYLGMDEVQPDEEFSGNLVAGGSYKVDESKTMIKRVDKRPPSPYTESSLIKSLEYEGIGRPSTYSNIVDIVVKRNYSDKVEGKLLITELGLSMSNMLEKYFPTIMQYDYTRNMELELDNISENKTDWREFLDKVFRLFSEELVYANRCALGKCEECNGDLVVKFSRKSKSNFISCSNYPNCKFIKSTPANEESRKSQETLEETCPECSSSLIKKKSKSGRFFVGCSNYPECKYVKRDNDVSASEPEESSDKKCPRCNGDLLKKKNK